MRKIKAEIHLKSIIQNARLFKARTGKRLCAVVKADAYGHGAEEVVLALQGVADCFAVALLAEAKAIKTPACGKDILILCPPTDITEAVSAVQNGFVCTVTGRATARLVAQASERCGVIARVHLKVNTGMNRYGCNVSELKRVCKFLKTTPFVRVEGLYSHLHDPFGESASVQRERFLQAERVCEEYFPNVIRHLSATAGSLLGESFTFDMVRIGIGLYGYLPDGANVQLPLKKAMTVYATVVESRTCIAGGVGYGKAFFKRDLPKTVSVLRIGYADGFLRKKDNGTNGFENNANALCMDACIRKGKERRGALVPVLTDAEKIAKRTDTIVYEVLCAATRRAERTYHYD